MSAKTNGVSDLIIGGVGAAYRNIAPAWRGAWAGLIFSGGTTGLWLATAKTSPHAPAAPIWWILTVVAGLMAKGAVFRLAVGRGKPGPGGLQLGRVEFNLIIVALLTFAFLFILSLLFLVVLLCTGYAVASAGPGFVASEISTWFGAIVGRGQVVFGLVALVGAAGMVWAGARISLAAAVTVARDEIQVLATWPMTRDRVVSIVLAGILTAAGPLAIVAVIHLILRSVGDDPTLLFAGRVAVGLILVGLWVPMGIGLMAYLQRRLS